ncbi:MAG: hypothetical protein JST84_18090 [Acidobacteria bacterium]|nr:hypothetical protein [Acidobacteriota bacterium]
MNPIPVVVVSSASYENNSLAPGSIASAFGTNLATTTANATDLDQSTPVIDLPTNLAGTTVQVDGQLAELLFVSPLQVNFILPAGTRLEKVVVKITSGNGTESNGTIEVRQIQPSVFTFNSDGQGVLAGDIVRVQANGSQTRESLFQFDSQLNRNVTKPIELGPDGERVFMELYLTGARYARDDNTDGNVNESFLVELGGLHLKPSFVGRHPVYAGLDQLNFEISRSLIGAGKISLLLQSLYPLKCASNVVEIEIAGTKSNPPPQPLVLETTSTTVGRVINIKGSGFSADRIRNRISIGGVLAEPAEVWPDKIVVWVPYGAVSGPVKVKTPNWEGQTTESLLIQPSISGWVETAEGNPLRDVTIRVSGTNISAKTTREGVFLLPNVPVGEAVLEVDPSTLASPISFPKVLLKTSVKAGQDNLLPYAITLQGDSGASVFIPAEGLASDTRLTVNSTIFSSRFGSTISVTIPKGTTVRFADGRTSGLITLTNAGLKVPGRFPAGTNSLTEVAQLTPFGAHFSKGLDLDYENAGTGHSLFMLDREVNRSSLGRFIELPNVQAVVTLGPTGGRSSSYTTTGPIQDTGYYYMSDRSPDISLTQLGQVVDADGLPVKNALVVNQRGNAQTDELGYFFTRGGGYVLGASYLRPSGRVERVKLASSISDPYLPVSSLVLPSYETNRSPLLLTPVSVAMNVNEARDVAIFVDDPDVNDSLQIDVSGPPNISLLPGTGGVFTIRLTPKSGGSFTIKVTVTDSQGKQTLRDIPLIVNAPNSAPTLTVPGAQNVKVGQTVSFDVSATDPDPGQTITIVAMNMPLGSSFTPASPVGALTGTFSWTPSANQVGAVTVTFTASDNASPSLSESKTVTITVTQ